MMSAKDSVLSVTNDNTNDKNITNDNRNYMGSNNIEESSDTPTEKLKREMAHLVFLNPGPTTKDLLGFRPEYSNREKKKLNRLVEDKLAHQVKNKRRSGKRPLYDENGKFIDSGKDLCDCLIEDCLGCHYPCPQCQSPKCGSCCRANRRWKYESVFYHTR